jgi:hypothetical protein
MMVTVDVEVVVTPGEDDGVNWNSKKGLSDALRTLIQWSKEIDMRIFT